MKKILLSVAVLLSSSIGFAQTEVMHLNALSTQEVQYNRFVYEVNTSELQYQLASAPNVLERKASLTIVSLPMPNGNLEQFEVYTTNLLAPALAAKYPQIKTYKGIAENGALAYFDVTDKGLNAIVFNTGNGTVYINSINTTTVESYYKNDYVLAKNKVSTKHFGCEVVHTDNLGSEASSGSTQNKKAQKLPGEQLRKYRLALACTGEYAQFHGGTKSGVLSAMVTTMNRVNGIYERENAITMEIIGNTDTLIFLDANTDPYTNNSGGTMLGQNQNTVDNLIGNANYDIGHVFSTGGGGIAGLGVVCRTNNKARGVTGSASPVNDSFDVDYVAHEMGHQFGANHTQNNNCNRNSSTAYEPGSASTIMGYAGICAPNLQSNSDDYFHLASLEEIYNYTVNGSGGNCPQEINTGNSIPVADAGEGGYIIPHSTPFELFGSGTDADNDPITYCWEQYDLGPSVNPATPSGNSPAFRSFLPTTDSNRVFPRMQDVLDKSLVAGEAYINYSRNLRFRLTVRDNNSQAGAYDFDEMTMSVDASAGPFVVNSPLVNESYYQGNAMTVTWDVANTDQAPINCSEVDIIISTDNGATWTDTLVHNSPNDGSQEIVLPMGASNVCYIRVQASNNVFFNVSGRFRLLNSGPFGPTNLVAIPDYVDYADLTWDDNSTNEGDFVIERSPDGVNGWTNIGVVGPDVTTYRDFDANFTPPSHYRVYARNSNGFSPLSNVASYGPLSISEELQNSFTVYPNPFNDVLVIQSNKAQRATIQVVDLSGKTVIASNFSGGPKTLSTANLASGVYFVHILKENNATEVLKLIK